jgi:hypothetical protein
MDRPPETFLEDDAPRVRLSYVAFGLILLLLGVVLLDDRLEWIGFRFNVPIWTFILIALGLAKLGEGRVDAHGRWRPNRSGAWLLILGVWGLFNEYRLFGVHYLHSWPLLVIAAGTMVVWHALDPQPCTPTARTESRS